METVRILLCFVEANNFALAVINILSTDEKNLTQPQGGKNGKPKSLGNIHFIENKLAMNMARERENDSERIVIKFALSTLNEDNKLK